MQRYCKLKFTKNLKILKKVNKVYKIYKDEKIQNNNFSKLKKSQKSGSKTIRLLFFELSFCVMLDDLKV